MTLVAIVHQEFRVNDDGSLGELISQTEPAFRNVEANVTSSSFEAFRDAQPSDCLQVEVSDESQTAEQVG